MRQSLKSFLEDQGKIGLEGIDTRALTRRLRLSGAMKGIISTKTKDIATLLEKIKAYPGLVGRDLVWEVSCPKLIYGKMAHRIKVKYPVKSPAKSCGWLSWIVALNTIF